ncbi:MAG: hypothetical protein Q6K99_09780 [Thermostichales cyanobacterium BF4_bins_65]
MVLSYRGVQFARQGELAGQPLQGSFRGQSFVYKTEPLAQPGDFQFRGLPTRVIEGSREAGERVAEARAIASVHQANIRRRLDQRLESARQRGDERLVTMLEDERQQMA